MKLRFLILPLLFHCILQAQPPVGRPALPTPQQIEWQDMELSMFVHFAPNTWQGIEQDDRSTSLSRINPSKLDVDQWIDAAESFGAKQIIFVAKHSGGFCMWQTSTTDYSIKNTPYKNGKGDVLDEIAQACLRRGMKFGIYIYPGDDTWGAYQGGGGRTKDSTKQEAYNKVLRKQWEEVLSRYGKRIREIWYDGGLVVPLKDIVMKFSPDAIVFQGPFASIRWVGNEDGIAPYPAWNSLKWEDAKTGLATAAQGDPDGDVWMPLEVDVTLKNHFWFWNPDNHNNIRSLDELMDIYSSSVGRGGLLLLNSSPDTTGRIPDEDMAMYRKFGDEIRRRFSTPVASTSGKGDELTLKFASPAIIDNVVLQEDIAFGERVRAYVVEGDSAGTWKELAHGLAIGHKRIERFSPVTVPAVRVRFIKYSYPPIIRNFSAYNTGGERPVVTFATDCPGMGRAAGSAITDSSGGFVVDLSTFIPSAGQYQVFTVGENGTAGDIRDGNLILEGVLTPGLVILHNDGTCVINITASPMMKTGSIVLRGRVEKHASFSLSIFIKKTN